MRRLLLFLAAAAVLFIPAGASAIRSAAPTDGTFVVENGYGTILINGGKDADGKLLAAKGALVGSLGSGTVTLTDPAENDTDDLKVSGCQLKKSPKENQVVCSGQKLRYRVVGGKFRIKISSETSGDAYASDINLSVVGRGQITVTGAGLVDSNGDGVLDSDDDGRYKLNDDGWKPLPNTKTTLTLEG